MIPDDFITWGTVVVKGQQITLTPEITNEFFGLLDIPEAAVGWEEHEFFTAYNYDLAGALRMNGSGYWAAVDNQRDSWSCHPKYWNLALSLPDHAVL
ncbi:hypothetical protein ACOSQ3_025146 [Xanthoceras sorbifolium]